jgi:hypothetical protein
MANACRVCGQPSPDGGICAKCAGSISAGEPPAPHGHEPADSPPPDVDIKARPTAAGCILSVICTAVIFGSAVPIVTWREPETGQPLPRWISIAIPFLLGALCYAAGVGLLKLLGIAVLQEPREPTDPGKP